MRSVLQIFAGFVLTVIFAGPIFLSFNVPQDFEGRFFPIVKTEPVDTTLLERTETFVVTPDTYRDEDKACFYLQIEKLRDAALGGYTFFVSPKLAAGFIRHTYPITPYLADPATLSDTGESLFSHAAGKQWERFYCFKIDDAAVTDLQAMIVSGFALHKRHVLYETPSPITPFTIPALKLISPTPGENPP